MKIHQFRLFEFHFLKIRCLVHTPGLMHLMISPFHCFMIFMLESSLQLRLLLVISSALMALGEQVGAILDCLNVTCV